MPVKRRAARFIEALAESGNVSLACETAGIGKDRVYRLRREDSAFAGRWAAAKAAFEAREDEAEETLDEERLRSEGMVVRRGRDGRVQVSKAHPRAWGKRHDRVFFAALADTGNISAAARAAGFTYKAAWERKRTCPAFAERLREAKAASVERLEFGLIEQGEKALGAGSEPEAGDGAEAQAQAQAGAVKRDPELAKWLVARADKEQGAGGHGARGGGRLPRIANDEEVVAELTKRVSALEKRVQARREGAGWTQTEEGHWIPPGYGRAA